MRVELLNLNNISQTYSILALFGDLVSFCIHVQTATDGINKTAENGSIKMFFYTIFCVCVYILLCFCSVIQGLGNTPEFKQLLCSRVISPLVMCFLLNFDHFWPIILRLFKTRLCLEF